MTKDGRKVPWLRISVEGAVIVGSILLAFAIDAAWERSQERGQEIRVLEALLTEFETNRANLPSYMDRHRQGSEASADIQERLREAGGGNTITLPDTLLFWPLATPSFDPATGAVSAALQSGDMRFIPDATLRQAVAGWPSRIADSRENEDQLNIRDRPALVEVQSRQVDVGLVTDLFLDHSFDPGVGIRSRRTLSLRASTELLSWLARIRSGADQTIVEHAELLAGMDSVIAALRVELGR